MKSPALLTTATLAALLMSATVLAGSDTLPPLNKITLQLQQQGWATTKTAKVIVSINASLNQQQLATVHSQILADLSQLSKKC